MNTGEPKKFFAMGENLKASKISAAASDKDFKEKSENFLNAVSPKKKVEKVQKLGLTPVAGTKNKVFVQPAYKEEVVTASGFITELADTKELKFYGTVIGISPIDESGAPAECKLGDTVYFGGNFTTEEFEGVQFLLMKEGNIYGKL